MALKKFSQFSTKTSLTESDYVVGYGGTANIKWTFTTIWNWITSKANSLFSSSEFAVQSSVTESDSVVGYGGAANKKWTFTTIWNWITSKANSLYARLASANTFTAANTFNAAATFANDVIINSRIKGASLYTGYEMQTYSFPANTAKWVRVLVTNNGSSGVMMNFANIIITNSTVDHTTIAKVANNYNGAIVLDALTAQNQAINTPLIEYVRHVYKESAYTGEYGYFEMYVNNTAGYAINFTFRMYDSYGWAFALGDGSIPDGYMAKELALFDQGKNSLENIRKEITFANPLTVDAREYGNNYYTIAAGLNGTLTVNVNYLQEGREVTLLVLGYKCISSMGVTVSDEQGYQIEAPAKADAYPFAIGSMAYITVKNVGQDLSFVKIENYG